MIFLGDDACKHLWGRRRALPLQIFRRTGRLTYLFHFVEIKTFPTFGFLRALYICSHGHSQCPSNIVLLLELLPLVHLVISRMIPSRSSSNLENKRERLRLLIEKSFDSLARIEVVLRAGVVFFAVLIVGQRWA